MIDKIYNIHWDGPFGFDEVLERASTSDPLMQDGHVFYQLYGTHPLYGPNQLLYIGKTVQGISRFHQHSSWVRFQPGPMQIHLGSLAVFPGWNQWKSSSHPYPRPDEELGTLVPQLEALCIYGMAPALNSQNISSPPVIKDHFRIFNTGKHGQLAAEISTRYMVGD